MSDEIQQIPQNLGSEDWIERALAAKRVMDFVIDETTVKPKERESTKLKKAVFLDVYANTMGTITLACQKADIDRTTYYAWKNTDGEFAAKLIEIEKMRADMVDDRIYKLIQKDDAATIRWYAERTMEKYKSKSHVEHEVSNIDFSDMVDEIIDEMGKGNKTE